MNYARETSTEAVRISIRCLLSNELSAGLYKAGFFIYALKFAGHILFMTRKERYQFVINYFQEHAPEAETELIYDNPYQLLVSVILSAQCTDKRVNMTTPAIFASYPDVYALSKTSFDELFPYIKSISYPNNKTKTSYRDGPKSSKGF